MIGDKEVTENVGEGEEHGLRPLNASGSDRDDITYGMQPKEPVSASEGPSVHGTKQASGTEGANLPKGPAHQVLSMAVSDTESPARGILAEAEAERLAQKKQPKSVEFAKGSIQPASEGAV